MHVTGHSPLASPGNNETDALVRVRWLELAPSTDVAHWLHRRLQYIGTKTIWQVNKQWGLPLKWQEVADASHDCVVCAQNEPWQRKLPWETQQITQRKVPLTHWQVDYIGPLSRARNAVYAFTAIDMATGLLFAWPCPAADQWHTAAALTWLCALYGHPQVIKNDRGTHFTGQKVQHWAARMDI